MAKEKTNIEHLRDILGRLESHIADEAHEFLDAIGEDQTDLEDENKSLKNQITSKDSELSNLEQKVEELVDELRGKRVFLGLDTMHYRLEHGNLLVQDSLDEWVRKVQKQNAVVPA